MMVFHFGGENVGDRVTISIERCAEDDADVAITLDGQPVNLEQMAGLKPGEWCAVRIDATTSPRRSRKRPISPN